MRKQYYFRPSERGLLAWDVDRLIERSSHLPRKRIPLHDISELDEVWFGDNERPTWRAMLGHVRLIEEADLSFPIILSATGAVMDGISRRSSLRKTRSPTTSVVAPATCPIENRLGCERIRQVA